MNIQSLKKRIPAILVVLGIFSLVEFYPGYRDNRLLEPGGEAVTSTGEVVSKRKYTRRHSDWFYEVRYVFPVDGDFLAGTHECQCEALRAVQEGDSIEIRYLPDKPSVNRPAAVSYSQTWLGANLIAGIVFLLLGFAGLIRNTI